MPPAVQRSERLDDDAPDERRENVASIRSMRSDSLSESRLQTGSSRVYGNAYT